MNEPRTGPLVTGPTVKQPGDLILTSTGVVQVQADGSVKPWKRPKR